MAVLSPTCTTAPLHSGGTQNILSPVTMKMYHIMKSHNRVHETDRDVNVKLLCECEV